MNDTALQLLKRYWGYDGFRGIQREIIDSICSGQDTLGLMPTGGGKSVTFQVPALAMDGVCIVVTPLVALMKDQVEGLRKKGIKAAAIHSAMSRDAIISTLENAIFGYLKLLYVSPERLSSDTFRHKLRRMKVSFICVDEAHCISQWGYDFRPSYLSIANIREDQPNAPVLALTATATPDVIVDITDKLKGHGAQTEIQSEDRVVNSFHIFQMSFERKNLAYVVRPTNDKMSELLHILDRVDGSAIVYARSREKTKETAILLQKHGVTATWFHAGLEDHVKDMRQKQWHDGEVRVIVATNAFGMGIDKPDVRLVIHIGCPDSIEAYFQEAGRAGRDGRKAYAVLLWDGRDRQTLLKRIPQTFPEKDYIRKVYDDLAYFYQVGVGSGYNATFEFPIDKFCTIYHHFPVVCESALKILDRSGYIEYMEEDEHQARLMFMKGRDELYRLRTESSDEERVLTALLRNYSGLFTDYVYISESLIAHVCELKLTDVYLILKSLDHRNILSFIPQKRTPFIRYRQRREDSQYLIFPKSAYDDLKVRFEKRVSAMLEYAESTTSCRSRMLLEYFGERRTKDCGHCDVCMEATHPTAADAADSRASFKQAKKEILSKLSDGRPHLISDILKIRAEATVVADVLSSMLQEEEIEREGAYIKIC